MVREAELKEKLIAKINETDNVELLEELSLFFDIEEETDALHEMTEEEDAAVREGLEQLKKGQFFSHEESNRRADEWLKKYDGR